MLRSGSRGVGGETKKGDDLKWPFSLSVFTSEWCVTGEAPLLP